MAEHVFPHFGTDCPPCLVCKTNADAPTVLVPIPGTERDGIMEAKAVHKECRDLVVRMSEAEEAKSDG